MTNLSPADECAAHLAALVTPKDSTGYARLLKDNERYLAVEIGRFVAEQRKQAREQALEEAAAKLNEIAIQKNTNRVFYSLGRNTGKTTAMANAMADAVIVDAVDAISALKPQQKA